MYKCPNTDCAIHQRGKEMPVFMTCPLCDTPLESQRQFTPFQLKVKDNFPYVIAYPFTQMLEESSVRNRLEYLTFTLINILKYLGLITASEYYHSPIKSQKLNELFRNNLYQPSIGNWNQFIREAIKELNNQKHKWIFPELTSVYENIETGSGVKKYKTETEITNEDGEPAWIEISETAIGTLINFRNKYLGHGPPLNNEEYGQLFEKYYPVLEDLLTCIAPLAEIAMYKSDHRHLYKLMGLKIQSIDGHQSFPEENVWIEKEDRKLNLLPFFVLPQQFAGIKDNPQVFVYEQNTSARLVFFSPESKKAESKGDVLEKMNELIAEKENERSLTAAELTRAKIDKRIDANNLKMRNGLIREKKIIEGVYQNRNKEEEVLMNWIGLPYGLLFVNAEAGSGKTNLLDYANTMYQQQKHSSLFLRANHLDTGNPETVIKKLLNIDVSVSMQELLQFYTQQDPLLIVIDGGNEHADADNFLKELVEWLLQNKGGALKIVMSWRSATDDSLPNLKNVEEILYKAPNYQRQQVSASSVVIDAETGSVKETSLGITSNQTDGHPFIKNALKLEAFNREELLQVWRKYAEYKEGKNKKLFAPQFTAEELEKTDKPLLEQLYNPLLLRMFLEEFNNKKYKAIGNGFTEIWEFWWRALSKNARHVKFLSELAIFLAEKDRLAIELDELYEHPELGKEFENLQSDSPYRQLLEKGELLSFFKNNKLMSGFVMEKKFYFVLSHSLIAQQADKETILNLLQTSTKWEEAIMYYLNHQVKNKQYDLLFELIDEPLVNKEILSKPLAQAIITEDIQKVLDGLLQNSTIRDWQLLGISISYLNNSGKEDHIKSIANVLFNKAILFEPYQVKIGTSLFKNLSIKQKNIHVEKTKTTDLGELNIENVNNFYSAMVTFFEIGDLSNSIKYAEICEGIYLQDKKYECQLGRVYLNKAAALMGLSNKGEEAFENLNKAEIIFSNYISFEYNNLIVIYLNYCLLRYKIESLKNKSNYYLNESYRFYNKYSGNDISLLLKIKETDAEINKFNEPQKAVDLWKSIIEINHKLYGDNAFNNEYYHKIAETSCSKEESLKYYRLYLKEARKEIYAFISMDLIKDYFWFAYIFYWWRGLFFRGFFYGIMGLSLSISFNISRKYFYIFLIPMIILVILFTPIVILKVPKRQTNWGK